MKLLTFGAHVLKAAGLCAEPEKSKTHEALKTVRLELDAEGTLVVAAMTRGSLFAAKVPYQPELDGGVDPFELDIPASVVKGLPSKGAVAIQWLNEQYALESTLIDDRKGLPPTWRNLVPQEVVESGPIGKIDPTLAMTGKKALALFHGVSVSSPSFEFNWYPPVAGRKVPAVMFYGERYNDPDAVFVMAPRAAPVPAADDYQRPTWL